MSYVVNWQRTDGATGWHPVDDVQEAVTFVEHLRNGEGADAPRIFKLDEVAFEWRPYYKVELAAVAPTTSFAASIAPDPDPDPDAEPAAVAEPDPVVAPVVEDAELNGTRRGLFGR